MPFINYANKFHFKFIILLKLTVLLNCTGCNKIKILGIFPHPGKSHLDCFKPLFLELAAKGHDVTIIGHFPLENPIENYRDISLNGTSDIFLNVIPVGSMSDKNKLIVGVLEMLDIIQMTAAVCENAFKSKELQEFVAREEKFDIVMTEFFLSNCLLGLMHHTGGSLIGLTSSGIISWMNDYISNPNNPSYIPSLFIGLSNNMNFGERCQNFLIFIVSKVIYKFWINIPANEQAKKYISENISNLDDFYYNTSLILANVHHTIYGVRPEVPALIEVGGLHIGTLKKLPQVFMIALFFDTYLTIDRSN